MAEDREQDQSEERDSAARPVTAAARRERRASASGTAPAGRAAERTPARARPSGTRTRKPAADEPEAEDKTKATKGKATPKRDRKDKRPSVIARFFRFLREVIGELRKVIWPTRKQQLTYTVVVLVFVAVIVALVSGLDLLFAKGVFWVFA